MTEASTVHVPPPVTESLGHILHLNVRLTEGGAAGVARTLAAETQARGIPVTFAYGYGRGGHDSVVDAAYRTHRVTQRHSAAANMVSHSILGREVLPRWAKQWTKLEQLIASSSIVHMHVVHSYFLRTDLLLRRLCELKKPVVWTLHDHWSMTGRCAQPAGCELWTTGCQRCPNKSAYPPAQIDRAGPNWTRRRLAIQTLQQCVPTAIVACASWLGEDAQRADFKNVHVIQNSVDREYWDAVCHAAPQEAHQGPLRALFVCRDLRDRSKVDWSALEQIAKLPGVSLTIVGDNAVRKVPGAQHYPALSDRKALANLFLKHDLLVFTSAVDYYPLTIAEGVTAGLLVAATESSAAREFASHKNVMIASNIVDLVSNLSLQDNTRERDADARAMFDPARMTDDYLQLYASLLEKVT
jgi:putative colanic acid biosynthesis glycosyltransferase